MKNIIKCFTSTITDTELSGVSVDFAEKMFDDTLEDGLIKDIPILRTLYGLYKAKGNIGEYILAKKILYFINEISDINIEKRQQMIDKINDCKEQTIKVGEKLIYILNRCEDHEKALLMGKIFRSYLEEGITYDMFIRCSRVIDVAHIQDLKDFVNYDENLDLKSIEYQSFVYIGVVTQYDSVSIRRNDPSTIGQALNVGQLYPMINETGKAIREILVDYFA